MDALLRLGARAIGAATDVTTGVRPTIAPVFLAGPSGRTDLPEPGRLDEPIGSALMPPPSTHRPIARHPVEVGPAADHSGPVDRAELDDPRERAAPASRDPRHEVGAAISAHSAESQPDRPGWRTPHADRPSSATFSDPPPSAPVDHDRGRAERRAARRQEAPEAGVQRHDSRGRVASREPPDGGAQREPGPTATQQEAVPSARFLATLRTIRDSVAAPERPHAGEDSERPPAVRVTIGRIEVRSVPAAAEPGRAPAPPSESRITLAEYLSGKRRSTP
jgi:hypothetical protein